MINFVVTGLVLSDSGLVIRLSFEPCRHRSHLLRLAGNAHVLSGYVERVTRRHLRVGKNRHGLLGDDDLSEKQED